MAQEAQEAPVGRSRSRSGSSTSPATGMWESPRLMQAHTPFPSWIPYAGTFADGAGSAAAAEPSLPSAHGPDHAWNQSAPSMIAHGGSGYRGNFLSLLEAKTVTPEMFEDDDVPAACDYLGLAVASSSSSMAAAGPAASSAFGLLFGSVDPYSTVASSAPPVVKHETTASLPPPFVYSGDSVVHGGSMGCIPCYDHEEEPPAAGDSQRQGFGAPEAAFLQQMVLPSRVELQSAVLGYSGMVSERPFGVGSLTDAGSFSDYSRSSSDFVMPSISKRQEQDVQRQQQQGMGMVCGSSSGSGAATSAVTRRKSEERVGGNTKKSKQEAYRKTSPPKPQAPKVKLGEKITALQQIVSPFGKLFSEPYMTKSTYKGHIRREKEEESRTGHDLRGRWLCLVPVSLTSQAYHDDTVPHCWAPAYRSCLYP